LIHPSNCEPLSLVLQSNGTLTGSGSVDVNEVAPFPDSGGGLENRHFDDAIAESHASSRTFGAENEILHAQSSVGAEKAHLLNLATNFGRFEVISISYEC
jgi:hypothetical protein